jgi:hypothetical protein
VCRRLVRETPSPVGRLLKQAPACPRGTAVRATARQNARSWQVFGVLRWQVLQAVFGLRQLGVVNGPVERPIGGAGMLRLEQRFSAESMDSGEAVTAIRWQGSRLRQLSRWSLNNCERENHRVPSGAAVPLQSDLRRAPPAAMPGHQAGRVPSDRTIAPARFVVLQVERQLDAGATYLRRTS